ncbi:hypothetical protein D3C77_801880 [compost metagenome]
MLRIPLLPTPKQVTANAITNAPVPSRKISCWLDPSTNRAISAGVTAAAPIKVILTNGVSLPVGSLVVISAM